MSCVYLESFLNRVGDVPEDLNENFGLIKEMNSITRDLIKEASTLKRELFTKRLTPREKKFKIDDLVDLGIISAKMADQKIDLFTETYEMVDEHIKNLESDLIRLQNEIMDGVEPDEPPPPPRPPPPPQTLAVPPSLLPTPPPTPPEVKAPKKKGRGYQRKIKVEIENIVPPYAPVNIPVASPEMPQIIADKIFNYNSYFSFSPIYDKSIDPNEPTYCFGPQASFGNMIGCESPKYLMKPYQPTWRMDLA